MRRHITAERLREVLSYSPDTGEFVWLVDIGTRGKKGARAGSTSGNGRRHICLDRRTYQASRLAYFFMAGSWPTKQIDHTNVSSADNRWVNLRPATSTQNQANRLTQRNNQLGTKGVRRLRNKYTAQIRVAGQLKHLGTFASAAEAHAAYTAAAKAAWGEYARAS